MHIKQFVASSLGDASYLVASGHEAAVWVALLAAVLRSRAPDNYPHLRGSRMTIIFAQASRFFGRVYDRVWRSANGPPLERPSNTGSIMGS